MKRTTDRIARQVLILAVLLLIAAGAPLSAGGSEEQRGGSGIIGSGVVEYRGDPSVQVDISGSASVKKAR